jgi:hypothetical protein
MFLPLSSARELGPISCSTQPSLLSCRNPGKPHARDCNMHCNENPIHVFLSWQLRAASVPIFPHSFVCERFIYSQDRSTYYYYYSTIYSQKTYPYHLTITYIHLITITLTRTHNTTLYRYCRPYFDMSSQNFTRPRRFDLLY